MYSDRNLEHPDVTYIERNGEAPYYISKVSDGICMAVELSDEEYHELTADRRRSNRGVS